MTLSVCNQIAVCRPKPSGEKYGEFRSADPCVLMMDGALCPFGMGSPVKSLQADTKNILVESGLQKHDPCRYRIRGQTNRKVRGMFIMSPVLCVDQVTLITSHKHPCHVVCMEYSRQPWRNVRAIHCSY
jgi:hypothetical protein